MSKLLGVFFLIVSALMIWQHLRYLTARRNDMLDRQPMIYASESLHVVTFLELAEGAASPDYVLEQLSQLRQRTEGLGGSQWVYAGLADVALESKQLGPAAWDAAILQQYPSRDAYESVAKSDGYREALGAFAKHHSIGLKRPWLLNLAIPQLLLGLRVVDILRGGWTVTDFVPDTENRVSAASGGEDGPKKLRELSAINPRAVVVFNFLKAGTPEQQAADKSYGLKMLTRMAALAHGPVHAGKPVTLEGEAEFDSAVFMYYPGPDYMADMLESTFFRDIAGDKQPGDTLAVLTVPILDRL